MGVVSLATNSRVERPLGTILIALQKLVWGLSLLVLAIGTEVLHFKNIDQPVQFVLTELGVNPRGHIWAFLVGLLPTVDVKQLARVGIFFLVYGLITLVECWGVWYRKLWVESFLVLETAAFLPLEVGELLKKFTVGKLLLFAVNLYVVFYLSRILWQKWRKERPKAGAQQSDDGKPT